MFTKTFWKDVVERASKTAAQALLTAWVVADGVFNLWSIDPKEAAGIALGGFVISVLTSLATGLVTSSHTASTVKEVEYLS